MCVYSGCAGLSYQMCVFAGCSGLSYRVWACAGCAGQPVAVRCPPCGWSPPGKTAALERGPAAVAPTMTGGP